jgi:D-glycero-alpha-D-manno-heptose-7-phosphate kinase
MIITKTPLRISFAGGGTDLPAFYENETYGAVVNVTIDKYVYIALHPFFDKKFLLKYSQSELVDAPEKIAHPIIRESLLLTETRTPLEITSFADVPARGTGLGSSSAFCVGLLHALSVHNRAYAPGQTLARMACEVEIERIRKPIGKQDQYSAAIGGLNYLRFNADGSVFVYRLNLSLGLVRDLQARLLLFYTGTTRDADSILAEQRTRTLSGGNERAVLLQMRAQADRLREELQAGNLGGFGELLHEAWLLKRRLANSISNPAIDAYYERARAAGASGGKLLGAGGGGFLVFYVPGERQSAVRAALSDLQEMEFSFDMQGTRIAHID